ncbi:MAG: DUF6629 family protein [Gallionellaceae bacterium]|jgi:hypothetical protein
MCISAAVSFSAAVVLLGTGAYAVQQARRLPSAYLMWALIPVLFGIQQAFEGGVWQLLVAGNASAAQPFALGYHFFSDFLWPWWLPLSSYLVESSQFSQRGNLRKRVFLGLALFGAFNGTLAYMAMLLHPEWLSVTMNEYSISYDFSAPYRINIPIPLTIMTMITYGVVILVPLLFSSHRLIRIFGVLIALSMAVSSLAYNEAFVSVWCFFAAALSLYLVYMIRRMVAELKSAGQAAPYLSA